MTQAAIRWVPPPDVVDHSGDAIDLTAVFFAPPPPSIGQVFTAHSAVVSGKKPGPSAGVVVRVVLLALLGALIGGAFLTAGTGSPIGFLFGAVIGGALLGWVGTLSGKGRNSCSYTGSLGLARYFYSNDAAKRSQPELFLFQNAVEMRTAQTRQYYNGVYTGTSYSYTWTGRDGKVVFRLSSSYRSEKGTPDRHDPFYYARAAEISWSRFLLQFVNEELNRSGAFRFNLRGNNCVVAGQGYLDLYMNGQQIRCLTQDIANVDMKQGVLTIRRKDATSGFLGIGAKGVFSFTYSELANGRVFLMLLEQLVDSDSSDICM